MLLTALANRRRDNNPHTIRGIMYSMHSASGRAGACNHTPRGDGRCSGENRYAENRILVFLVTEHVAMGTISYDVIAIEIVSTLLPNNLMFFIVQIIMKIISSDKT